ncbi:MAG TPA: phosphohistidine phosphatase SixA [Gemmatimonadaceae bacterium]
MKVYFLRHGIAGERSEWKGVDAERPLTSDGIGKMRSTAKTLAHLDLGLDAIITSPLVRAKQTAEIVAEELGLRSKMSEDKRVGPGFNEDRLRVILREHAHANAVMLVGHEPDLSSTISALIGGGRIVMKKGGLALVELPDAQSRRGELLWLSSPKWLAS